MNTEENLWEKYEKMVRYNSSFRPNKNYYESIKVWNGFYNGDQWQGLEGDNKLPHPMFNIIKRVIEFKIASLTSSDISVNIEPLENVEIQTNEVETWKLSDFMNAEISNVFEKCEFKSKVKEALLDAAITGDMCIHTIFNPEKQAYRGTKGEIEIELIDATNVGFGNPNIKDVEKQPYIIIVGRDTVKNLQKEAKSKQKIEPDKETEYQVSDYTEIEGDEEGKALYIYYYYKKDGKVYCSKATQYVTIFKDVDMKMTRYPIAFANWYKQKNTFHGRGEVEGICPNQITINKLFAMAIYHQMTTAFPIAIYDKDLLDNWSNEIGTAIEVKGLRNSGLSFRDVAGYLEPANMSDWIIKIIDLVFQYTKECLGVSDASLGQINPTNTSAIIAVQKSTAVPLANIKDNLYSLVEQEVLILLDIMAAKYGVRPVLMTDDNGARQLVSFDFSALKDMDIKTNVDVGEASYWSELTTNQTLDNLLQSEKIDFIDYLERMPNNIIPKKAELIQKLKEQVEMQQGGTPGGNDKMYEQMAQYMDTLPMEEQQRIRSMQPQEMENYLVNLMQQ